MTYTVTIAGVTPDPEVYAGLLKASAYIGGKFGPAARKWRGLDEDDKERSLLEATRYLDLRDWAGTPSALGGTTLQFPRTGTGITDDAATQLARVEIAVCELALLIASDPSLPDAIDGGSNIRVLDADGAKIEFFAPTSVADGNATVMPPVVQRLLGRYTAAAGGGSGFVVAGGVSFGTGAASSFDDEDRLDLIEPF